MQQVRQRAERQSWSVLHGQHSSRAAMEEFPEGRQSQTKTRTISAAIGGLRACARGTYGAPALFPNVRGPIHFRPVANRFRPVASRLDRRIPSKESNSYYASHSPINHYEAKLQLQFVHFGRKKEGERKKYEALRRWRSLPPHFLFNDALGLREGGLSALCRNTMHVLPMTTAQRTRGEGQDARRNGSKESRKLKRVLTGVKQACKSKKPWRQ